MATYLWLTILVTTADSGDRVDYVRDIKPLLEQRCYACHGALEQESGLRLDTGRTLRQGGDSGPAVTAGDPDKSLLIQRVSARDENERMPPEGAPLSPEEIALLAAWIRQGAVSPDDEAPAEDPRRHWAFQAPVRPPLPAVGNRDWLRTPIDAFIAAEHEKRGLNPLAPAERHVLLRRVYLDLVGIPPTREELAAFLADDREDAYERVVDRLLDSPQYGERWGRHWMDVWRYSDWYGRRAVPDVLNSYAQIWRWRDWIVRSLNEDKGYDRMIVEMLAADEVAPCDDSNVVATGFLVRNFYRWNYNTWMKDNVEHTAKAFLGLTLNCCQCHDHKYDPITQEEYFRFRAFFEPLELRHDRVAGEPDPGPFPKYSYGASYKPISSGSIRVFDEKLDAQTFMYSGGESRNIIPGKPPVSPGGPAILGGDRLVITPVELPPAAWYPGLKTFVQEEEIAPRQAAVENARKKRDEARERLAAQLSAVDASAVEQDERQSAPQRTLDIAQLDADLAAAQLQAAEAELASVQARIEADKARYLQQTPDGDVESRIRSASRTERTTALCQAQADVALAERELAEAEGLPPNDPKRAERIDASRAKLSKAKASVAAKQAALEAPADQYALFSPQYPKQSTGRRSALARWIASRENPLTARVAVNHIWLWHFGRALVDSTNNFGRSGSRPTHPELLDWLASELMDGGWQMKRLHRLIVTSNVYRMRSTALLDDANRKIDRENQYLWRFAPARMEAEVVRDSILHVAGQLDLTIGGKELDQKLGLSSRRRSLYFAHHGEEKMEFLELFDAANACDCYRRTTSVRPQQALALTNSDLAIGRGRELARRLQREVVPETSDMAGAAANPSRENEAFVVAAFRQVLARRPSAAELEASLAFLQQQTELLASSGQPSEAADETKQAVPPAADPATRAREDLVQALFSHSDFVTIR